MKARRFAEGTTVAVERTLAEIGATIVKHGGSNFTFSMGSPGATSIVAFKAHDRFVRFSLPMPRPDDRAFLRGRGSRELAYQAELRRVWRALLLCIRAKLEVVATGITSFEDEFLAHIVVPGGETFGDWARPKLADAYASGVSLPPLLGDGGTR